MRHLLLYLMPIFGVLVTLASFCAHAQSEICEPALKILAGDLKVKTHKEQLKIFTLVNARNYDMTKQDFGATIPYG